MIMCGVVVSSKFYIKNIYLFFIYIYIYFLIKYDKQVHMTNSFNKWIILGLRNFEPFNKLVGLVLTHIVKYS